MKGIKDLPLMNRILKLNSVILEPGKRTKIFMTPKIRAAIRKRNKLRNEIKERKQEWISACGKVNEMIK